MCRCRTRDASFEPPCFDNFFLIGGQMDIWATYGPYFAVAAAISLGAGALRDAMYKAAASNRIVIVLAGLGHAAAILVVVAFTLVGFFDWITPYRDGLKTGQAIIVGVCAISGAFFCIALLSWAWDLADKFRKRKSAAKSLRTYMNWYVPKAPNPQSGSRGIVVEQRNILHRNRSHAVVVPTTRPAPDRVVGVVEPI
ncbi:hypothetical protein B2J88_28430 [Rhodococcus sp. SRB_17]|nr:hypothetical protein [Rhodococcus sp. SRB_17]